MTIHRLLFTAVTGATIAMGSLGCSKGGAGGSPTGAPVPGAEVPAPRGPVLQGTSSAGGGGNGIGTRPIEDFKKNIHELTEYKYYIQPILDRMEDDPDPLVSYLKWTVRSKSWFFVPQKLENLNNDRISLAFKTDQLARHAEREIFFDEESYKKASLRERAVLLLHEMVMGAKLLMKKTPREQCEALRAGEVRDCTNPDLLKLVETRDIKPEERNIMDGADHQAVRRMTNFLLEREQDLSAQAVRHKRRQLDFVYPWDQLFSDIKLSDVLNALRRSIVAGDELNQASPAPGTEAQRCVFKLLDDNSPIVTFMLAPKPGEAQTSESRGQELSWGPQTIRASRHLSTTQLFDSFEAIGLPRTEDPTQIIDQMSLLPQFSNKVFEEFMLPRLNEAGTSGLKFDQLKLSVTREAQPRVIEFELIPHYVMRRNDAKFGERNYEYVRDEQAPRTRCLNASVLRRYGSARPPAP